MSRNIILVTRGHRHRYTRGEKLAILGVLDKLMVEEGMNQARAGAVLKVDPACLTRWAQKKEDFLENIKETKTKMSDHQGPVSVFADIEKDLLNYIEEWRQKGFDVNRFTLLRKAGQLKPEILQKSTFAIKVAISRFLAKHGLTHRVTTHQAQRDPRKGRQPTHRWNRDSNRKTTMVSNPHACAGIEEKWEV